MGIILKSLLNCIDNTGASVVECALVLGQKKAASIGDRIVVVVQKHRSNETMAGSANVQKARRGDIRHAVVVRTRQMVNRRDGSTIRFGDNACVLINKAGEPIGTRITGVVGQDLRKKGWGKIMSMALLQA